MDAQARLDIIDAWERRKEEAQKHAVSRTVQLYLDKSYFVAIESTGHKGKPQDFIKDAIMTETQKRFQCEMTAASTTESDKERADRLQGEVIALQNKLNDTMQSIQAICSNISI